MVAGFFHDFRKKRKVLVGSLRSLREIAQRPFREKYPKKIKTNYIPKFLSAALA